VPIDGSNWYYWQRQAQDNPKAKPSWLSVRLAGCGYDERRRAGSYRPPQRKTVGPLAIIYTWIRPEISLTASTMLMMEVDEQTSATK